MSDNSRNFGFRQKSLSSDEEEESAPFHSGKSPGTRQREREAPPSVVSYPFRGREEPSSYSSRSSSQSSSASWMGSEEGSRLFFARGEMLDQSAERQGSSPSTSQRRISFNFSLPSGYESRPNAAPSWDDDTRAGYNEMSEGLEGGGEEESVKNAFERMSYTVFEDPRNYIINMIIDSATGSVELTDISQHLNWGTNFEKVYGTVAEYLQGYHSIFVVSPIYDRVTLCRPVISSLKKSARRHYRNKKQTAGELVAAHIGSISCSCVAEGVDIEEMYALYHRRGYEAEVKYDVLHVYSKSSFDLFIFQNGVVVWWGMNRRDHWVVEDDFFSCNSSARKALSAPFSSSDINVLFPDWSSYEADDSYLSLKVDEKASERFSKMLCFDHYRIPKMEPDRTDVMLTVSFCIGRSACIDYYEHVTQTLHHRVLSIPLEFSGLLEYFSTQHLVRRLEGELQVTQLALTTLKDKPDFLWEMPWLYGFYDLTEVQCTAEQRLSWFCARGDALLEKLSSIKTRRFRLFMLGSDVFLIGLLIFDVMVMTARLIVKLYFKVEES